jgi:uncharacterized membrane protein YvbJ
MIKQNWNDKEVLVMDKNDIQWLLQYLKPEYEKRKKAYEKVKKQFDEMGADGQPIRGSEYSMVQGKYAEAREKFQELSINYEYLKRFAVKYAWEAD